MFVIEILGFALLGLMLGSFATFLVYRVPRNLPWASLRTTKSGFHAQRSACPSCKAVLTAPDLVPLLSWLFGRGRCRHCQSPISWVYPLLEIISMAVAIMIYLCHGTSWDAVFLIAVLPFLLALLFIDIEFMILPNVLVLIIGVLGVAFLFYRVSADMITIESALWSYAGGAIVYGGLSYILGRTISMVLKKDALGFGDVKFFTVAGLWLGVGALPLFLIFSGVLGLLLGLGWRFVKKQDRFPFGPALILSFYIMLIFEDVLGRSLLL